MKVLPLLVAMVLAGCAFAPSRGAKADYITGLEMPVVVKEYGLILDGGSGTLLLVDTRGREARLFQDCSGANIPKQTKTWYGRRIGEIILGDLRKGRVLDYFGDEGVKLLQFLDSLHPEDPDEARGVRLFADFIRKQRSGKT